MPVYNSDLELAADSPPKGTQIIYRGNVCEVLDGTCLLLIAPLFANPMPGINY